jgi:hypothetical protein
MMAHQEKKMSDAATLKTYGTVPPDKRKEMSGAASDIFFSW